jgi:DNA-binding NtrC family response regulator
MTVVMRVRAAVARAATGIDDSMARVLIAEDDPDLCWIWSETLADAGHEVVVAHDGDRAAALLETQLFDVMVCDVIMPASGAIVLTALARMRQPGIRVIVVTGSLALRDRPIEEAVDGADRTLRKPIDLDRLCLAVEDLLRARAA